RPERAGVRPRPRHHEAARRADGRADHGDEPQGPGQRVPRHPPRRPGRRPAPAPRRHAARRNRLLRRRRDGRGQRARPLTGSDRRLAGTPSPPNPRTPPCPTLRANPTLPETTTPRPRPPRRAPAASSSTSPPPTAPPP